MSEKLLATIAGWLAMFVGALLAMGLHAHAACITGRGGDVEYALRDCAAAVPTCLRGVYPSADTLALINGSRVSPRSVFLFHKSGIWNGHSASLAPDPAGNAMLWAGYNRVPGLSSYLRAHRALDSERFTRLTGAQLISMGIARACK